MLLCCRLCNRALLRGLVQCLQAMTPSLSARQLSDVSTPRGTHQPGTPKWLSPISEVGSSPLQLGLQPSFAGEPPCLLQNASSIELASGLDMAPASPAAPVEQAAADFMTPRRPSATLEFPVSARDPASTPTLLLPPAAPTFSGSCLPLKKLHSGKLHLNAKPLSGQEAGPLHMDVCSMARQASVDLKARHDLETKRLEMSAEAGSDGGKPLSHNSYSVSVQCWLWHECSQLLLLGYHSRIFQHQSQILLGDRIAARFVGALSLGAHGSCVGAGASSQACVGAPAVAAMRGSRLGKALKAMQLGSEAQPPKASFQDSCGCLLKPFESAKDAPAWKAPALLRTSPSGGSLSISPYLAKQREARNLQNTWDDLLARQALEASAAEHLAEWAKAHLPATPAAQA